MLGGGWVVLGGCFGVLRSWIGVCFDALGRGWGCIGVCVGVLWRVVVCWGVLCVQRVFGYVVGGFAGGISICLM